MGFSRLRKASDYKVEKYLIEKLELTPYQAQKMRDREVVRFSKYDFYESVERKGSIAWRLTAPIFLLYCILLIIALPFKWIITGNRYLPQRYLDNFHYRWVEKMGW